MVLSQGLVHLRPALASPWSKPVLWLMAAMPLVWLVFAAFTDQLGANPAEALERRTGEWALRLLCITLSVTPLRVGLGLSALARMRRMLGLWTYAYASLHVLAYAWLDMGLVWQDIAQDIPKRPFVLVGVLAWLLLTALALTSFNRVIRWLGSARWQALHRAVYAVAVLAVLHFFWMRAGKHNFSAVAAYAAVLAALLGWRVRRQRFWRFWVPNKP